MNFRDAAYRLREFWAEFRKETWGLVGLGILVLAMLVVLFEPLVLPYPEVNTKWRNIDYWQDNSPNAPPVWTNWFRADKAPVTQTLRVHETEEVELDGGVKLLRYVFPLRYSVSKAPLDLIFHGSFSGDIPLAIQIERPDGLVIEVAQRFEQGLSGQDIRVSADNDGKPSALAFLKEHESADGMASITTDSFRTASVLFSTVRQGMARDFIPLNGEYRLVAQAMVLDPGAYEAKDLRFTVVGSVSGILGTDDMKRDLFSGLMAGLKWALLIGLLTSAVSVLIGVMYGIIAAYFGGIVDTVMMFFYQIVNSIPVLPVLIVISAIFKPNIVFLITVMVVFFWTGSVMTVRSMALQIKEETYIEAARALGAGSGRILFRHMMPILIPYSFASMALSVPSAIVYESSVSLLGLGDATIVTWGQILHDAMQGAAILKGVWWWVLPPGLLIAVMGMTFAFLGFAMDKILHPKLKTR